MGFQIRTRIYIDGYNFYYGCLKRTPYKWLDPIKLFEASILPSILFRQDGAPATFALQPLAIKYFTAPILKNFASSDDSVSSQSQYHSALQNHCGQRIQLALGYYDSREAKAHLAIRGKAARDCDKVEIWKLEEKQSDVNLALHAFGDAIRGEIDHAVIVTNDTDLAPAVQQIKLHTQVAVGIVIPSRKQERPANSDLIKQADWVRTHITDDELSTSQLPRVVLKDGKAHHKPLSWYPRPDLVAPAVAEAIRVRGGRGSAMKWLGEPNFRLGDQIPMEMLSSDAGAAELAAYMAAWASENP